MIEENFSAGVLISVSLHLFLVAGFTMQSKLFPKEKLIYQEALRVDIVGLPDKVKTTPVKKKPAKKAPLPTKNKSKAKPKRGKRQTKALQNKALSQLKALNALERLKSTPVAKNQNSAPTPKYRGNVISAGTALKGVQKLQHERYIGQLKQHIQGNWYLPEWLTNKDLKAEVRVKIDPTGELIGAHLVTSSNSPEFDKLAQQAVENSNPFPKPPEKFKEVLEVDGVTLRFP